MCHECGLCCHEKTIIGDQIIFDLDSWCVFFDPATRKCTIYAERFALSNRCRKVDWKKAMFASYLPPTCGYVEWAASKHLRFAPYKRIRYQKNGEEVDPALFSR